MIVIPKPASTVILMDEQNRVYLTKRPKTMKFLGGFYVFPGGAVEDTDDGGSKQIKNGDLNNPFQIAYYVAAARELFEEVGILLCEEDDGSIVQWSLEKERNYRRLLIHGEISFLQILKQEGIYLNLNQLKYFGNLITPKGSPYRFDTNYFLSSLPLGQTPRPDNYEIDEAFWLTPEEAIAKFQKGELPMIKPTILVLQTIIHHLQGGPLMIPKMSDEL